MSEHTPLPWKIQHMPSETDCRQRGDWLMLASPDWFRAQACVNAFHDPQGRTIATEQITEGLFWDMYDALLDVLQGFPAQADEVLDSLKIEESEDG